MLKNFRSKQYHNLTDDHYTTNSNDKRYSRSTVGPDHQIKETVNSSPRGPEYVIKQRLCNDPAHSSPSFTNSKSNKNLTTRLFNHIFRKTRAGAKSETSLHSLKLKSKSDIELHRLHLERPSANLFLRGKQGWAESVPTGNTPKPSNLVSAITSNGEIVYNTCCHVTDKPSNQMSQPALPQDKTQATTSNYRRSHSLDRSVNTIVCPESPSTKDNARSGTMLDVSAWNTFSEVFGTDECTSSALTEKERFPVLHELYFDRGKTDSTKAVPTSSSLCNKPCNSTLAESVIYGDREAPVLDRKAAYGGQLILAWFPDMSHSSEKDCDRSNRVFGGELRSSSSPCTPNKTSPNPIYLNSLLCASYKVLYMGSVEVKTSVKSLDPEIRSQIAKESIRRVCESLGMKSVDLKFKASRRISNILSSPSKTKSGPSEVILTVGRSLIKLLDLEGNRIVACHELRNISFVCSGDSGSSQFVTFVAKDFEKRLCYVLKCADEAEAYDIVSVVGRAFQLSFKEKLKRTYRSGPDLNLV